MLTSSEQGDANKFKKEREEKMNYNLDGREIIDPTKVVNEVAADLQKEKYLDEYIKTMQQQGEELNKADVSAALDS